MIEEWDEIGSLDGPPEPGWTQIAIVVSPSGHRTYMDGAEVAPTP